MKKSFIIGLLIAGGIMFTSAQSFSGCVTGNLAGVNGCVCMNTATNVLTLVAGSYCLGTGTGVNVGQQVGSGSVNVSPLFQLLDAAQNLVARAIPFLTGLAVVALFWYIVQYIFRGGDSAEVKKHSLAGIGYSIIAILVMVAIWGIIAFFFFLFGIGVGGRLLDTCLPGVDYALGTPCRPN